MATVDRQIDHPGRGLRPAPEAASQRGQESLADIIVIRPLPVPPRGERAPRITGHPGAGIRLPASSGDVGAIYPPVRRRRLPLSHSGLPGSPTTLPETEHGVAIANAPAASGRSPVPGPTRDNRPLVLVVDDEESYRQALASGLTHEGFAVESAGDGHEALRLFHRVHPDLVLLDVMLPDQSGIEICQQMRSLKPVPIIMVTARDSEVDIVLGLELGASDYVAKPFRLRELVARMRAVLRRGVAVAEHHEEVLAVGPVRLDAGRREVTVDEVPVELSPQGIRPPGAPDVAQRPGRHP